MDLCLRALGAEEDRYGEELQGEEDGEWNSTSPDSQRGLLQRFKGVEGVTERGFAKLHSEFR